MVTQADLVKGAEYKVKYEGEARAARRTYEGPHQSYTEDPQGNIVKGDVVAQFNGKGGWKFYAFDKIVQADLVDPAKEKPKKLRTCDRCYGAGKFEHVAHVANGVCFKCHGTGKL